jgi:hypothetical protein
MSESATPQDACRCGHVREAHEHYRRGSDCGICGAEVCSAFELAEPASAGDQPAPAEARPHSA